MIYSEKILDVTQRPDVRGRCFTGLETAAILGAVSAAGSMGMGIIGGMQQSAAQQQAGETAYRTALMRNQHLEAQARELENQAIQRENEAKIQDARANDQQAVSQRKALEQKRRAGITASRAGAVMAASGAGVDSGVLASILAEGEYAGDVSIYEGDVAAGDSRYGAKMSRYQGDLNRYEAATKRASGSAGVAEGAYTRDAAYSRASSRMATTVGSGLFKGLTLAEQYAPDLRGTAPGTGATISGIDEVGYNNLDWSRYDARGMPYDDLNIS